MRPEAKPNMSGPMENGLVIAQQRPRNSRTNKRKKPKEGHTTNRYKPQQKRKTHGQQKQERNLHDCYY